MSFRKDPMKSKEGMNTVLRDNLNSNDTHSADIELHPERSVTPNESILENEQRNEASKLIRNTDEVGTGRLSLKAVIGIPEICSPTNIVKEATVVSNTCLRRRPQAIIDMANRSGEIDSGSTLMSTIIDSRLDIVVAAATSSNIGDLSISDGFAEITVEKLDVAVSSRVHPAVILSMTARESTCENLVSSTSESKQPIGIGIIAFAENYNVGDEVSKILPKSDFPLISSVSPTSNTRPGRITAATATAVHEPTDSNDKDARNGNNCNNGENSGVRDADVEEDGDGEDDDSSGIILKDETDSAEDEASSEDEVTDSASETGADTESNRVVKPIITISDQNYPRLVINFGDEQGKPCNYHPALASPQLRVQFQPLPKSFVGGIGTKKVGNNNNNSIKGSTYIPIENWVANAQRYNKRKRMDSERTEEMP